MQLCALELQLLFVLVDVDPQFFNLLKE